MHSSASLPPSSFGVRGSTCFDFRGLMGHIASHLHRHGIDFPESGRSCCSRKLSERAQRGQAKQVFEPSPLRRVFYKYELRPWWMWTFGFFISFPLAHRPFEILLGLIALVQLCAAKVFRLTALGAASLIRQLSPKSGRPGCCWDITMAGDW